MQVRDTLTDYSFAIKRLSAQTQREYLCWLLGTAVRKKREQANLCAFSPHTAQKPFDF